MKYKKFSFESRKVFCNKSNISLALVMILAISLSGCITNVKTLGRDTDYDDKRSVAKHIETEEKLEGQNLIVSILAKGDRPYKVIEIKEEDSTCGFTYSAFQIISENPMLFLVVPIGLIADTVTLCQTPSHKYKTVVEQNITHNAPLPVDLLGDVTGHLKISETNSGAVFTDKITQYATQNGVIVIPLPLLNNGGSLRIELEGDVAVGSKKIPLTIDRQVAI